jgi:hypothetical protein
MPEYFQDRPPGGQAFEKTVAVTRFGDMAASSMPPDRRSGRDAADHESDAASGAELDGAKTGHLLRGRAARPIIKVSAAG